MTVTRITEDGRHLAQCRLCGTWREVQPDIFQTEMFFEVLQANFRCCGQQQCAIFTKEKDTVDFH